MNPQGAGPWRPVRAVLLDLHHTLVRAESDGWFDEAWGRLGRPGTPLSHWGGDDLASRTTGLGEVWRLARRRDPGTTWDLSARAHRDAFTTVLTTDLGVDPDLAGALYDVMPSRWRAYDDTLPVLTALLRAGVRTALVSNTGLDPRAALKAMGVLPLLDAVTLSFEVGLIKPGPAIFQHALDQLDVRAEDALMVGDTWDQDGGAAALGVRTLILPQTSHPARGLDAVLALALGG